jgi:hypothetical protein
MGLQTDKRQALDRLIGNGFLEPAADAVTKYQHTAKTELLLAQLCVYEAVSEALCSGRAGEPTLAVRLSLLPHFPQWPLPASHVCSAPRARRALFRVGPSISDPKRDAQAPEAALRPRRRASSCGVSKPAKLISAPMRCGHRLMDAPSPIFHP